MPRLSPLTDRDALPESAHAAYDYLLESRGAVRGGYAIGLRSPDLIQRMAHVGSYFRDDGALPRPIRTLVSATVSSLLENDYEAPGQTRGAVGAGVPEDVVAAAARGEIADGADEQQRLAITCCTELLNTHRLTDATASGLLDAFGEAGFIEMLGAVGYYSMLAVYQNGIGMSDSPRESR